MTTTRRIRWFRKYLHLRNHLYFTVNQTLTRIKSFDQLFMIIMAIAIGIAAGYIAAGFRMLIGSFQSVFWGGNGTLTDLIRSVPIYVKLLVPAIGTVAVAVFVNRFAKEAKGHGVPEVMNAVATQNGFIRMRVVLVKAFASAMSIGTGAAVGREGPIVQIGSAFGSTIGQIFQVSQRRMNTFIGCGAAAGIAATFNAPIAGAIFASEVILGDFSIIAIGPIIISAVFGTVISRSIYGDFPAFIPPEYTLISSWEIVFYIILGIGAGLIGFLFVRFLYYTEDYFDHLKLPVWAKALAGGLFLGVLAIFIPEVMGVGYESMDLVLSGKLSLLLVFVLMFGKILATSVSLGAGASGGIFAPSLFIGSMLGGTMGLIFHSLFPDITSTSGAYALVGMAAMVAAATHAPFTAILIIFEMTSEYTVILPLMVASIIATVITTRMLDGNIYTIKLKRRGIDIHQGADVNILKRLSVPKIKDQLVDIVNENDTLASLLEAMSKSNNDLFFVHNEQQKLTGIVTLGMVRRFLNSTEIVPQDVNVVEIQKSKFESVTDETPVNEVLRIMLEHDMQSIPVVDSTGKLTGQVQRNNILREYQELLVQTQSAGHLASEMKYIHRHYHEKVEIIPGFMLARISCPSEFVQQSIRDLHIRERHGVDILIIRRPVDDKFKDIMPASGTVLQMDDQILVFGPKDDISRICRLT